ncbi:MAG: DNA cytosine methyltransferase [Tannerellaceae bacterium]|jgi:DNA (cytosine-5)-methyltransferase 1|nr:DNA cytosine methyltransferase [Tannerellaceae bacterium]
MIEINKIYNCDCSTIKNLPENIKLLYIDLFCGAGGTSTGVENAMYKDEKCAKVIACVNHDANAIASHAANHPDALHFTEDIRTLELSPLVSHIEETKAAYPGAIIVLWASLECTNFSKAKGGQARDADSRTLAEHLFRYIEAINPDYIQIENVEEFMSWGELDENGKPISRDAGRCYGQWVERVKQNGYTFKHRILNAADYGAYTSRKRFFGIFAKQGLPIEFPTPTHSKTGTHDMFNSPPKWKPVKDVLDFSDEGESIFIRKKPLSDKTLERIHAGLIKFVAGGKDNFLSSYYGVTKNFNRTYQQTAKSVDEPCGVITTKNRFAKAQAQFISKYYSGHPESKNKSINEPADTITAIDHHSLIGISFIQQRNGGNPESKIISTERPARTITATGGNQELVQAQFLGRYNGQSNQEINAVSIEAPAPTLTVKDRLSLISPRFIVNEYSGGGQHSSINEVCPAILTTPKQKVVSCKWIMDTAFNNKGTSMESPMPTITASRKWHYIMNPQYFSAGGSIEKPCFTIIARMDKKPPYLISTENGDIAIEVYDTDSEPMRKIKEFMALYGIIDIKMRMLKIPELKRIMGFPEDYTLIGTQADQKKFIGNAVEVNMARVMCEALCHELCGKKYHSYNQYDTNNQKKYAK